MVEEKRGYEDLVSEVGDLRRRLREATYAAEALRGSTQGAAVAAVAGPADVRSGGCAASEEVWARSVLEQTLEVVVVCDAQAQVMWANRAACALCGETPVGRPLAESLPLQYASRSGWPELEPAAGRPAAVAIGGALRGTAIRGAEVRLCRADGESFDLLMSVGPLRDAIGQVWGAVVTLTDISDRKRDEEAVRESEERFRTVADSAYGWEYWLDPEGTPIYVSPSCRRLTGYGAEEFYRDPGFLEKIVHPDDRAAIAGSLRPLGARQEPIRLEFRVVTREGPQRWIELVSQPVFGKDGRYLGLRGSGHDVTAYRGGQGNRVQPLRQVQPAGETAEDANYAKSQFLAIISHELRTPMNAMLGMTELALGEELSPTVRDYLETAKDSADSLLSLLNEILDYSRIEAGKLELEAIPFGLRATIYETI